MRLNDAIVGVVLVLFAMAVMAYSTTFPTLHGQAYGPSLFPVLIGGSMAACGLMLIARGVSARSQQLRSLTRTNQDATGDADKPGWIQWGDWVHDSSRLINMLLVPGLLIAYIVFSDIVGFIPFSIFILSVLLFRLGTTVPGSLVIATGSTVLLQLLFAKVLLVPLPAGLLLRWIG